MPRKVEFLPDGQRIKVSPNDVATAWRAVSAIPAQYICGTSQHESAYTTNERDTEVSGFVSDGIFQLSKEEATEMGMPEADLLTLEGSIAVFAPLCKARLDKIVNAAKLDPANLPSDVWAYLALAHNEGLGACLKTIAAHGLDWAAWVARNPKLGDMAKYGSDCISGGERWGEVGAAAVCSS